eukprot:4195491-Pyramimonas_sp.AAC.1
MELATAIGIGDNKHATYTTILDYVLTQKPSWCVPTVFHERGNPLRRASDKRWHCVGGAVSLLEGARRVETPFPRDLYLKWLGPGFHPHIGVENTGMTASADSECMSLQR